MMTPSMSVIPLNWEFLIIQNNVTNIFIIHKYTFNTQINTNGHIRIFMFVSFELLFIKIII